MVRCAGFRIRVSRLPFDLRVAWGRSLWFVLSVGVVAGTVAVRWLVLADRVPCRRRRGAIVQRF